MVCIMFTSYPQWISKNKVISNRRNLNLLKQRRSSLLKSFQREIIKKPSPIKAFSFCQAQNSCVKEPLWGKLFFISFPLTLHKRSPAEPPKNPASHAKFPAKCSSSRSVTTLHVKPPVNIFLQRSHLQNVNTCQLYFCQRRFTVYEEGRRKDKEQSSLCLQMRIYRLLNVSSSCLYGKQDKKQDIPYLTCSVTCIFKKNYLKCFTWYMANTLKEYFSYFRRSSRISSREKRLQAHSLLQC